MLSVRPSTLCWPHQKILYCVTSSAALHQWWAVVDDSYQLSSPSERSEWPRYCFHPLSVCLPVCLCAADCQSNQFGRYSYWLQIWRACPHGQSRRDPLKIFRKGGVARVTWPLILGRYTLLIRKRLKLRTSNVVHNFKLLFCKNLLGGDMRCHECLLVLVHFACLLTFLGVTVSPGFGRVFKSNLCELLELHFSQDMFTVSHITAPKCWREK